MKKHFVLALLLVAFSLFSQFEITKHKGFVSAGTGYMINAERFTGNSLTNIAIPYGSYQLEGKTDEKSMYYIYADGGFIPGYGIGGFFKGLAKGVLKVAPVAAMFIPGIGPIASAGIGAAAGALGKKLEGGSWGDAAKSGLMKGIM